MAVTNPCKDNEPRVIDNELIIKCIYMQFPKGELGRLMREEKIQFKDIKEIRLEYLNILRIDHLWVLKSLTKLQLNNNLIETIENLETLVNLKHLDLSFNKISRIDNLDALVELEKINLFENCIKKIDSMDTLKKLTIFDVGNNDIEDRWQVTYLRKFKHLFSFNMGGNPCTEDVKDFRSFIIAFLPQLSYYEFKKISDDERQEAEDVYTKELRDLRKGEEEENLRILEKEREEEEANLHSTMFVEYLNSRHLFDELYERDPDGKTFLEMGEDIEEYYKEFEEQFIQACNQVFELGQKHYEIRNEELKRYYQSVNMAKQINQDVSIEHMEKFTEDTAKMCAKTRKYGQQRDMGKINMETFGEKIEKILKRFDEIAHKTWKILMKLELELYERLEDVNRLLERNLTDLINAFIEEAQAGFTLIRSAEMAYSQNLSDVAGRYLSTHASSTMTMSYTMIRIMMDKEALSNAIGQTHDIHLQIIDGREDILMQRAKEWLKNFVTKLHKDELKRNRYKVLEINHYLDVQREELEKLLAEMSVDVDEEDQL